MPAAVDNTSTSQSIKDWINKLLATIMQSASANPNTAKQILAALQKLTGQGGQALQQPQPGQAPKTAAAKQINTVNFDALSIPTGLKKNQVPQQGLKLNKNESDFSLGAGAPVKVKDITPELSTYEKVNKDNINPFANIQTNNATQQLIKSYDITNKGGNKNSESPALKISNILLRSKTAASPEKPILNKSDTDTAPSLPPLREYSDSRPPVQYVRSFDEGFKRMIETVTDYGRQRYPYAGTMPARLAQHYIESYRPEGATFSYQTSLPDIKTLAALKAAADILKDEETGEFNFNPANVNHLWAVLLLAYADKLPNFEELRQRLSTISEYATNDIDNAMLFVREKFRENPSLLNHILEYPMTYESLSDRHERLLSEIRTLARKFEDFRSGRASAPSEARRQQTPTTGRIPNLYGQHPVFRQLISPHYQKLITEVQSNPGKYDVYVIARSNDATDVDAFLVDRSTGEVVGVTHGRLGIMKVGPEFKGNVVAAFRPAHIVRSPTEQEREFFNKNKDNKDNTLIIPLTDGMRYVIDPYQYATMMTIISFYERMLKGMEQYISTMMTNPMMLNNPMMMNYFMYYAMLKAQLEMYRGSLGHYTDFTNVAFKNWKVAVNKATSAGRPEVSIADIGLQSPQPAKPPPTQQPAKPPAGQQKPEGEKKSSARISHQSEAAVKLANIIKLGIGSDFAPDTSFVFGKHQHFGEMPKQPTAPSTTEPKQESPTTTTPENQPPGGAVLQAQTPPEQEFRGEAVLRSGGPDDAPQPEDLEPSQAGGAQPPNPTQ